MGLPIIMHKNSKKDPIIFISKEELINLGLIDLINNDNIEVQNKFNFITSLSDSFINKYFEFIVGIFNNNSRLHISKKKDNDIIIIFGVIGVNLIMMELTNLSLIDLKDFIKEIKNN